jgi:hypothetical protein
MDRKELVTLVKPLLPVYVITNEEIFIAQDISQSMFRDKKRIEMYSIKTQEPQPIFPKCNTLPINDKQLITHSINDANEFFRQKKSLLIKSEYRELKEKYQDYTTFIKDNPELFLV